MPNNCLQWHDPALRNTLTEKPDFRINTHTWESGSGAS